MSHFYEMLVVIKVSDEIEWLIAYVHGHLYLNSDPAGFSQWSLCLAFTEGEKPSVVMQGQDWHCSW